MGPMAPWRLPGDLLAFLVGEGSSLSSVSLESNFLRPRLLGVTGVLLYKCVSSALFCFWLMRGVGLVVYQLGLFLFVFHLRSWVVHGDGVLMCLVEYSKDQVYASGKKMVDGKEGQWEWWMKHIYIYSTAMDICLMKSLFLPIGKPYGNSSNALCCY